MKETKKMKANKIVRAVLLAALFGSTWASAQGCGPSTGGYCNKVCDCQGCNATEKDECVDTIDDAKKTAEKDGCGSEFSELFACLNSELTCENDKIVADGCDAEATELSKCTPNIVGVGKDACEVYVDVVTAKYEGCGVTIEVGPGGEETECSDSQAKLAQCLAPCIDLLPCECIDADQSQNCTAELSQPYLDCFSVCNI